MNTTDITEMLLPGEYSVSPTKKVRFAKGNLDSKDSITLTAAQTDHGLLMTHGEALAMQHDGWRLLTADEWDYLLTRRQQLLRHAMGHRDGTLCLTILPDDMDTRQPLILPAAGFRHVTAVSNAGTNGYYWSATHNNGYNAYSVNFYSTYLYTQVNIYRNYGQSVRLVRDIA